MKVDFNSLEASQLPPERDAKQVSNQNLAVIPSATVDRTTFHSDSTSVQALTSQALNSPEVRQARVDALTEAVKSGGYQMDSTKTAGAIIESEGA